MMFKRIGNCIIDIEGSYITDTDVGIVYKFDFKNMYATKVTGVATAPFPIRYNEETKSIVRWKGKEQWVDFNTSYSTGPDFANAIMYLFNEQVERQILS